MSNYILRDYQKKTIDMILARIESGQKKIGVHLQTGAGKTLVVSTFLHLHKNKKIAFVVKRRQLVDQAHKSFVAHGHTPSFLMSGRAENKTSNLVVCSIDTAIRREFDFEGFDIVIYDEAWDTTSKSYKDFMGKFPKKTIHIGVSGSYGFVGNKGHEVWDEIISPISKMDLIKQKYLVFPKVFSTDRQMKITKKITGGDFNNKALYKENDEFQIYGSIVDEYKNHALNKKSFLFAINIEHSKKIVSEFLAQGIKAAHVDSTFKDAERKKILDDFESGDLLILSNVGIFGVGTDIPRAEVLICARPTKSTNLWEQMVGRVLRPYKGKEFALILDHGGNALRLGHPVNDFPIETKNKTKKTSDQNVVLKSNQCKKCFYIFGAETKACPSCGHQNEVLIRKIKQKEDAKLREIQNQKNKYDLFKKQYFVYTGSSDPETRKLAAQVEFFFDNAKKRGYKTSSVFFKSWELTASKERLLDIIYLPDWFLKIKGHDL